MTAEIIVRVILGLLMFLVLVLWLHFYSKFATEQIRKNRNVKSEPKEADCDGIKKNKA